MYFFICLLKNGINLIYTHGVGEIEERKEQPDKPCKNRGSKQVSIGYKCSRGVI